MREGWTVRVLGDVSTIVNGGTPKSKVSEFWGGEVQWLTPKDMGQMHGREIASTPRTITKKGLRGSSAQLVPERSVILSTRAPIGHLAINTAPMAFNQGCRGLIPKDDLNHVYLYYFLVANRDVLNGLGTGATFRELSAGILKSFTIPLPPLPEQQRIVAILDEAFAGIATAVANTEKNLANARELFDSYLNAVFTQKGVGWVERRIVEVSREFGRGKSKHRPRNEPRLYNGPYPFIQTGDISNADHWLTDYTQTYSEVGLAQSQLWPKGTICIAIVGATVGETAILNFEACFPDSVIGIVVNEEVADNEYVEFLLQSFKALLKEKGKGTARDNINLGTFENQRFPFPALKRQKDIVSTLNALREETNRLQSIYQHKLTTLADLKQSLLHKAFSGELTSQSVSVLQEAVA